MFFLFFRAKFSKALDSVFCPKAGDEESSFLTKPDVCPAQRKNAAQGW
jgi:hypothetical protein